MSDVMNRILLDLSHTSHTRARTGIQKVARSLAAALGPRAIPLTYDPYQRSWRGLQAWEVENVAATAPALKRGARWPVAARLRGRVSRFLSRPAPALPSETDGLVVPELFSPAVASALPALFASTKGPRVAVFHDAIALKLPEFAPPKTVARFPAYLRELLAFDGIAAVSDDSRTTLLQYWEWLGVAEQPEVRTIPLGIEPPARRDASVTDTAAPGPPVVLCVGSIEGRKNHTALLEACEQLWSRGLQFQLHLVGLAHAETGRAAIERLRTLQAAGRNVRYDGPVADAAIAAAYAGCTFTVYPSVMEGFGLPVLESLSHGKPCICAGFGALGESATGGGCLTLPSLDAAALAAGIHELLTKTSTLERLSAEACGRSFRTWSDYVADLTTWMTRLKRG